MTTDLINDAVLKLNTGLYGPRHCTHCNKTVRVRVFKLAGSDYTKVEGYKVTAGFVGSYACDECLRPIEAKHAEQATNRGDGQ